MHVDHAIASRKSIRRFLPTPVSRATVEHILKLAARAPSGSNIQPWRVHVVAGEARDALCKAMIVEVQKNPENCIAEYQYYPTDWVEPYLTRRRHCGFGLYEVLGIERHDSARREEQRLRNYSFFDAPVGLLISLDRRLNTGSFMDLGMFIQNILIAARGQSLHSCAQAAFADLHHIIRQHLPVGDEEIIICGISLGVADTHAKENELGMPREPVENFTHFYGFT